VGGGVPGPPARRRRRHRPRNDRDERDTIALSTDRRAATGLYVEAEPPGRRALGDPEPGDAERVGQPWRRGRDVRCPLPRS
jgi:hypothetical protein